jgi:hypothetical protein
MYTVKGSLRRQLDWWRSNIKNDFIVNIIAEGYRLPLLDLPCKEVLRNNKSARDNADFVTEEIDKLISTGVIIRLSTPPLVVNALSVAINASNKKRLVLDLRQINPMLHVSQFRYEDIQVASQYFTENCFMAVFDLKSGYHHVDIHSAYQQYLGLHWNQDYYQYSTCPFGLASAGLIFSKILRELVKIWRSRGIKIVMYLDDGIIIGQNKQETLQAATIVQQDLNDAGFVISQEKSIWEPSQKAQWLGFVLDSKSNIFEIPEEKIRRLRNNILFNLKHKHACGPRELAKSVGKICSLFHAFGSIVYILTKDASRWIAERSSWNNRAELPLNVINELEFWLKNLHAVVRLPLVQDLTRETSIVYSDASNTGCGAFVLGEKDTEMIHHWDELEKLTSSTWREIQAVVLFLEVHATKFKGKSLKWYTDNQGVPRIVHKGSMIQALNLCALEILQICLVNDIQISIDWVPRNLNVEADALSKTIDSDDWSVSQNIYNYLDNLYGKFTIDLFASNLSHKTDRFYAKYWCTGATGVDAFAYNWKNETCWMVPPPNLIPKILSHCKRCKATGILVIPKWTSAFYWPILHNGTSWIRGITQVLEYKNPKNFFKRGPFGNETFTEKTFKSNVVILKLQFQ